MNPVSIAKFVGAVAAGVQTAASRYENNGDPDETNKEKKMRRHHEQDYSTSVVLNDNASIHFHYGSPDFTTQDPSKNEKSPRAISRQFAESLALSAVPGRSGPQQHRLPIEDRAREKSSVVATSKTSRNSYRSNPTQQDDTLTVALPKRRNNEDTMQKKHLISMPRRKLEDSDSDSDDILASSARRIFLDSISDSDSDTALKSYKPYIVSYSDLDSD